MVIRAVAAEHALEGEAVVGDVDGLARPQRGNALGAPGRHADEAHQRDANAEMRERRFPTPSAADPAARRSAAPSGHAQDHGALDDVGDGARHDENREADAERRQHRTAALRARMRRPATTAASNAAANSRCAAPSEVAALPAEQRPERHRTSSSGTNSGPNVALKNGGPTEILSPVKASSASG